MEINVLRGWGCAEWRYRNFEGRAYTCKSVQIILYLVVHSYKYYLKKYFFAQIWFYFIDSCFPLHCQTTNNQLFSARKGNVSDCRNVLPETTNYSCRFQIFVIKHNFFSPPKIMLNTNNYKYLSLFQQRQGWMAVAYRSNNKCKFSSNKYLKEQLQHFSCTKLGQHHFVAVGKRASGLQELLLCYEFVSYIYM